MKNATLFREYVWLVNTIARADRISLVEINEQWVKTEISGGLPFARTTFNRHKDAIQDIFGIIIDCDRISHIELLDETFKIDEEFSATRYFSECFGVMVDERVALERVVLRAYGQERHYLRDLPLHPSQHELMETAAMPTLSTPCALRTTSRLTSSRVASGSSCSRPNGLPVTCSNG